MKAKVALLVFIALLMVADVSAQCAMCSAVAESAQRSGSDVAEGLNAGILYLMGIPYLLILLLGFVLFRKLNANRADNS